MKVLIAMSGGVDSSVAAQLMKSKGYDCIGCTMKLYNKEETDKCSKTCCSLDDVEDARAVAYKLDMPYYVFNYMDEFEEAVIEPFIKCYECGVTPNPCIECNRHLKFRHLLDKAFALDCDYIVTGHYARIEKQGDKYILKKAADESKDQSYVLHFLSQEQLAHIMFPLGEMCKAKARDLASESGFINADKPDSQDICFVPDGDYAKVISERTGRTYEPGNFVNKEGKILGQHKGIINYTIGQRKGLGLALQEPAYVCELRTDTNEVVLGKNEDLFSRDVYAGNFNWISGEEPEGEVRCSAKIRYRMKEMPCTAVSLGDGKVKLTFDEPQRAVTPGQFAVLYDGDIVLGGGVIEFY